MAAGLLGAGSVFLGPTGDTAEFLAAALGLRDSEIEDESLARIARAAVSGLLDEGRRIPGLGHPVHTELDPRTPRLWALADEEGLLGPHLRLLAAVADAHAEATGRRLPVNGAGAAGAVLVDIGVPPTSVPEHGADRSHRRAGGPPGRGGPPPDRPIRLAGDGRPGPSPALTAGARRS